MNTLFSVIETVKDLFTCGRKTKRGRSSSPEVLWAKRRRLSAPKLQIYNCKNSNSNLVSKSKLFYFDNQRLRKSLQTQILKGREEDKNFLKQISNRRKKCKRKLDFDSNVINIVPANVSKEVESAKLMLLSFFDESEKKYEDKDHDDLNEGIEGIEEIEEIEDIPPSKYEEINLLSNSDELSVEEEQEEEEEEEIMFDNNFENFENFEKYEENTDNEDEKKEEYEKLIGDMDQKNERNFPYFDYEKFHTLRKLINGSYNRQSESCSLIKKNGLNIDTVSFTKLLPDSWLNDEIINSYIELILRRNDKDKHTGNYPNIFIFNTFFYEKFLTSKSNGDYSYERLSKFWEKKNINLLNCRHILIPVNIHNMHWSLVCLNIPERTFTFYDSLKHETEGFQIMNSLSEIFTEYIKRSKMKTDDYSDFTTEVRMKNTPTLHSDRNEEEGTNKLLASFTSNLNNISEAGMQNMEENTQNENKLIVNSNNYSSDKDSDSENDLHMLSSFWKYKYAATSEQTNGSDCGVFVCKYMDYLARDQIVNFTQEDVFYFRYLIGIELLEGKLMTY